MAIQIRTSLAEPETGETFVPHRPQRPDKAEGGKRFVLKSDYEPAGDQPTAIKELIEGISDNGEVNQVLLGVTGSGKTFTMAKVIETDPAAGAGARAQQDPRRPAVRGVQELLSRQCGRIFRQLLRLLPARGLCAAVRYLHREGKLGERGDRPHAPLGDAVAAGARRRDHRRLGQLPLRHRIGRDLLGDDLRFEEGRERRPAGDHPQAGRAAVQAQRPGLRPRQFPGARRQSGDFPVPL